MRHELALARRGLMWGAAATAVLAAAGAAVSGSRGAASVLAAAAIVGANHLLAALSTGWARVIGPGTMAAGYGVFVVRMFGVLVALAVLSTQAWVHRGLAAGSFCAVLFVLLFAECRSYVTGSYVPGWRVSR